MAHLSGTNADLIARVRRIAGQVAAIERALRDDEDCATVLHLVAGVRGAVGGLLEKVLADHLKAHIARPDLSDEERHQGAAELLAAIRRYTR